MTLSLADTHGIAKCARTYIRKYTHTHTHKKIEKVGKKEEWKKGRGGQGRKKGKKEDKKKKRGKREKRGEEKKGKKKEGGGWV